MPGDRVEVLLHSRIQGLLDTGGGWTSDWVPGTVVKVNRVNVIVELDTYYFSWVCSVPLYRVRRPGGAPLGVKKGV